MTGPQDYTTSISVNKSPHEVYEALKDVAGWWVGEVAGDARELGSQFTYKYKEYHDTTQKVVELVPDKKAVWLVTKSKIGFVKNKEEWTGTRLIFEIAPRDGGAQVTFTHAGLTPAIECYQGCSGGWDFYIQKSLHSFLTTGKGIDPKF